MSDSPGDLREDVPLKTGTKSSKWFLCGDECYGESRLINVSFAVLTVAITFALLLQIYYGDYQVVPHGSVATDSRECSEIGTSILKEGGNAADAAIASAFCLAVVNPHVTSLDAEGQFMIYSHRTRTLPNVVDFRRSQNNKSYAPLPRMVIGLAYIHQQYSTMSWRRLIEPSINLAKKGFIVSKSFVSAIKTANAYNLFGNLEPGQHYAMNKLSSTLQNIADITEDDIYNYITLENTPISSVALKSKINNYNVYVPNTSMLGSELLSNLQTIDRLNFTGENVDTPAFYYQLAEATKSKYDELNITARFHEGTSSNLAVIDKDENYISLITGMYQFFGSQEFSADGYLLDKKNMDGVTCGRIPIIVTNSNFICGRRMVFGASNMATATQIIASLLIAANNATSSIESPRFNLLEDGSVGFEDDHQPLFDDKVIEHLETLGHLKYIKEPYSSSNIVEKVGDHLNSHSDSRGGGIASRFR